MELNKKCSKVNISILFSMNIFFKDDLKFIFLRIRPAKAGEGGGISTGSLPRCLEHLSELPESGSWEFVWIAHISGRDPDT